jgi:hypothetical protein
MATTTQSPDTKLSPPKATSGPPTAPSESKLPEFDLQTPLYNEEALEADKARRDAAVAAFRNEKAHERPPRHQA